MMSRPLIALALLALAGCDPSPVRQSQVGGSPTPGVRQDSGNKLKLAYSHQLVIDTAPQSVEPRFERARDRCLAADSCVLLDATISTSDFGRSARPHASLTVRLPHDAVAPFEAALLEPLAGQGASDASLRSRTTSAEDLTAAITDMDRQLRQLTDYRDRLTELAKRADAKIEDLVKVESELSRVQSEIEALSGQQRKLDERVATEKMTVDLTTSPGDGGIGRPIAEVWREGGAVLGENAASALRFAIGAIPWLPLVALVALLARYLRPILGWRRRP
jgi:hypothetical protein